MSRIKIRIIPQLDKSEALVLFVQKAYGKVLLLVVFSLFLAFLLPTSVLYLAPLLLVVSLLPHLRRQLVLIGTLFWAFWGLTWFDPEFIANLPAAFGLGYVWEARSTLAVLLGIVFAMSYGIYRAAQYKLFRKIPVWSPVAVLLIFAGLLSYLPLPPLLKAGGWALFVVWSKYVWFQAYTLQDCRLPDRPSVVRQLGVYQPFWYPSPLPVPKSASYLDRIECRNPESLAVCQLKALKLIMWAAVLNVVLVFSEGFVYGEGFDASNLLIIKWWAGSLDLYFNGEPIWTICQRDFISYFAPLDYTISMMAQGQAVPPVGEAWGATVFYFLMYLCRLSVNSHIGVAICRMTGFYAFRNVYKPFAAKDMADFFGRYFYYFKELLVTVFFYPVYFKCFKNSPKLRLFFATFVAACVGNTLFHLLFRYKQIMQEGIVSAALSFHPFAFYGLLLTIGIYFSLLKKQNGPAKETFSSKILRPILIFGFYCFAIIFATEGDNSIVVNFKFVLALFGFGQ